MRKELKARDQELMVVIREALTANKKKAMEKEKQKRANPLKRLFFKE